MEYFKEAMYNYHASYFFFVFAAHCADIIEQMCIFRGHSCADMGSHRRGDSSLGMKFTHHHLLYVCVTDDGSEFDDRQMMLL